MLGAIIGDIIGSVYEWNNIKTKDFSLFRKDCFFTDDTVMTVATADAIMQGGSEDNFIDAYKKWRRLYPNAGYGARFKRWLNSDDRNPYNSWGNGSAMRISPCAWMMDCGFMARTGIWPTNVWNGVKIAASVTHNHPEGIKGAEATAAAIFISRFYSNGWEFDYGNFANTLDEWKGEIKKFVEEKIGYNLDKSLDEIRPTYQFNESCQDTVPQAITAFLESTGFEDAIRNAISLGGDSDTLATITGSIAEAAYGIPPEIREKSLSYLDDPIKETLYKWEKFRPPR